jgi:hypothetical protein
MLLREGRSRASGGFSGLVLFLNLISSYVSNIADLTFTGDLAYPWGETAWLEICRSAFYQRLTCYAFPAIQARVWRHRMVHVLEWLILLFNPSLTLTELRRAEKSAAGCRDKLLLLWIPVFSWAPFRYVDAPPKTVTFEICQGDNKSCMYIAQCGCLSHKSSATSVNNLFLN